MSRHAIAVLALLAVSVGSRGDPPPPVTYCLIVSQTNRAHDVSLADARRIFLGSRTRWPGGRPIVVVIPPERSPARAFLLDEIVELSDIDFSQHWVSQVFRGAVGRAPVTAHSTAELRKFVEESEIAVGLIDCRDLAPGVRALTVDGKRPGTSGYALVE